MSSFVVRNGRVIDHYQGIDKVTDVFVRDGFVAGIGDTPQDVTLNTLSTEVDARGCLVTAGLVDMHVHAYEHATPLGVNIDERCLARGVTTCVDAGSAGASTFPGLRHFIREQSTCSLYCWLHIAEHGMAAATCAGPHAVGECDSLKAVNGRHCSDVVNANRDMIIGVKVRLATDVADEGRNEQEIYRRAMDASRTCGVPLMVHHAYSSVQFQGKDGVLGCPGDLQSGDVYTHCYNPTAMLDSATGRVHDAFWEARKRGVLFDVGHGHGSFLWRVLEQSAREGLWPDVISTDLHSYNKDGPVYDLPRVMDKLLHAGMPLGDIIAAVTSTPAKTIGKLSEVGHLSVGMPADLCVLKVEDVCADLEDSQGETRTARRVFGIVHVFKRGERVTTGRT